MPTVYVQYGVLPPEIQFGTGEQLEVIHYIIFQTAAIFCPPLLFVFCGLPNRARWRDMRYNIAYTSMGWIPGVYHASLFLHDVWRVGHQLEPKTFHPKASLPMHSKPESLEKPSQSSEQSKSRNTSQTGTNATPPISIASCPACRQEVKETPSDMVQSLDPIQEDEGNFSPTPGAYSLTETNLARVPSGRNPELGIPNIVIERKATADRSPESSEDSDTTIHAGGIVFTEPPHSAMESPPSMTNRLAVPSRGGPPPTAGTPRASIETVSTKATGRSYGHQQHVTHKQLHSRNPRAKKHFTEGSEGGTADKLCKRHQAEKHHSSMQSRRSATSLSSNMSIRTAKSWSSGHSVISMIKGTAHKPSYLEHKEFCQLCKRCEQCYRQFVDREEAIIAHQYKSVDAGHRKDGSGDSRGSGDLEPESRARHHAEHHHVEGCLCVACTATTELPDDLQPHVMGCMCLRCKPKPMPWFPEEKVVSKTLESLEHKQALYSRGAPGTVFVSHPAQTKAPKHSIFSANTSVPTNVPGPSLSPARRKELKPRKLQRRDAGMLRGRFRVRKMRIRERDQEWVN
ncbi:uncharacterized protein BDR25DRAFT_308621 [Lindgomyces ingoldianus]|uniref:Uncharacterized protein n=1 Tax=Lindgomyces ingoldianus TaxID=673940 RepID=A0ACB6RF39_9PLEO|nr:uncharacterized protein BDR25DRAFT_308621 [Lindgomyces ingoldianus]KAF2477746.1 hypothetical protein BDR25DRAFT_308621 [Lindgomyces ingoldianus]